MSPPGLYNAHIFQLTSAFYSFIQVFAGLGTRTMEARPPPGEGRMDREDWRCRPGYMIQFCKHRANAYKQRHPCAKHSPEHHRSTKDFSERTFQYRHFLSQRRNETSHGEEDRGGGSFVTHDLNSAARSPAGLSIA